MILARFEDFCQRVVGCGPIGHRRGAIFFKCKKVSAGELLRGRPNERKKYFLMGQGFKLKDSWRLRVVLGPPLEVPEFLRIPRYFHEKHQNNSKNRKIEKKEADSKVLCGAL